MTKERWMINAGQGRFATREESEAKQREMKASCGPEQRL